MNHFGFCFKGEFSKGVMLIARQSSDVFYLVRSGISHDPGEYMRKRVSKKINDFEIYSYMLNNKWILPSSVPV